MLIIKNKFLLVGTIIFCTLALLFALFVEYILGHKPCELCLIQRIPYMVALILAFLVIMFGKYEKIILIIIGLFFVFGTIISFYHFGIEKGFFNESLVCSLSDNGANISKQDLLKKFQSNEISCKDVVFRIFGLSLATINTIISFAVSVIMFLAVKNYEKN